MATIRFVPTGPVRCGAQRWRSQGKSFATVVVKVTLDYDESGAVSLSDAPDAVCDRDVHHANSPTRSLSDCSDLAPYLASGEVLFTGRAWVSPTERVAARFLVSRGGTALVDKTVMVRGDAALRDGVPVTCENALGGAGTDNPVGRKDPLVMRIDDPSRPAIVGPIPRLWRARADLLRPADRTALRGRELSIDEGFRWEFFHAAPADQRAPTFFSGEETILLEHLDPRVQRMEINLPGARAAARWMRAEGPPIEIVLRGDLLRIDADRRRISLVWRGFFETSEGQERMVVAAGVALPGRPIDWPTIAPTEGDAADPPSGDRPSAVISLGETGVLHLDGLNAATLPFSRRAEAPERRAAPRAPLPGAPFHGATAAPTPTAPSGSARLAPAPSAPPVAARSAPPEPVRTAAPGVDLRPLAAAPALDRSPVALSPGLGSILLLAAADRLAPKE